MKELRLQGVVPAHLTPFREDLRVDDEALKKHIQDLMQTDGVEALISNGHAGEVSSLSDDEYCHVVELVKGETKEAMPVISGVVAETAKRAAELSKMAQAAGADAILLFPPSLFSWGATTDSEIPFRFVSDIAEHSDLPIVLFQLALTSGRAYTTETLTRIVENIPAVIAIKEGTDELQRYEENFRALRRCSRHVAILCTNNTKLLPSLAVGADGIISGSGSVMADLLGQLYRAVEANDLFEARRVNDLIFPLTQVFYAPPLLDMHSRMKVALQLLGKQEHCYSRPPLLPIREKERERIKAALKESGLL